MNIVGIERYSDYQDYLEVHPDEFVALFNTLLINVTSFFRDRSSWEYVIAQIIPRIIAYKKPKEQIRVWSAGCASGEEAYTLTIAMAEVLGMEQFRERVKIYATDLDDEALNQARHSTYTAREVGGVPPELLDKYFEPADQGYIVCKDLRSSVIFGRHNLLQDAPISRVDLLVCRNTLMYFNSEAQAKILARFRFALNQGGFLFLGKAEMLLTHNNNFSAVDLKCRVFTKVRNLNLRDRLLLSAQNSKQEAVNHLANHVYIREAAFDASSVAQVVVDLNGSVVLANERARTMFGLTFRDLGRLLQDLELSYRPVELRSCIEQVYAQRQAVYLREIEWITTADNIRYLEVQVMPLLDSNGNLLGVNITFTDKSSYKQLQQELQHSNQELEMAYEELQSTNEELETTNEELQSTVEELETTNEELQSTNEELETMNEELQSTNEELQTINEELRRRSTQLNEVNAFFDSILTSFRDGVVVVNRELQIQVWNHEAEDLWGLRFEEVEGQHILKLDIGLPLDQLIQPIRACLTGDSKYYEVTLSATNRRGKSIQCKVTCTPLNFVGEDIRGVLLLMEDREGGLGVPFGVGGGGEIYLKINSNFWAVDLNLKVDVDISLCLRESFLEDVFDIFDI